ncbi:hypothetical protein ES708_15974 [subsurface metagenome]
MEIMNKTELHEAILFTEGHIKSMNRLLLSPAPEGLKVYAKVSLRCLGNILSWLKMHL